MHVRFSAVRGITVIDDQTQQAVAILGSPLLHPDTGRIQGFFVYGTTHDAFGELFLQVSDIVAWGAYIHIQSSERLSPPGELIRLTPFLEDPRTFLGQKICVEKSNRVLGVCTDIQFDTRHLAVEWIFPRKWFVTRQPIAASEIIEVTEEAIVVRDSLRAMREPAPKAEEPVAAMLSDVLPTQTSTRSA